MIRYYLASNMFRNAPLWQNYLHSRLCLYNSEGYIVDGSAHNTTDDKQNDRFHRKRLIVKNWDITIIISNYIISSKIRFFIPSSGSWMHAIAKEILSKIYCTKFSTFRRTTNSTSFHYWIVAIYTDAVISKGSNCCTGRVVWAALNLCKSNYISKIKQEFQHGPKYVTTSLQRWSWIRGYT